MGNTQLTSTEGLLPQTKVITPSLSAQSGRGKLFFDLYLLRRQTSVAASTV